MGDVPKANWAEFFKPTGKYISVMLVCSKWLMTALILWLLRSLSQRVITAL